MDLRDFIAFALVFFGGIFWAVSVALQFPVLSGVSGRRGEEAMIKLMSISQGSMIAGYIVHSW